MMETTRMFAIGFGEACTLAHVRHTGDRCCQDRYSAIVRSRYSLSVGRPFMGEVEVVAANRLVD